MLKPVPVKSSLSVLVATFCMMATYAWAWPQPLTQKTTLAPILIKEQPAQTIGNPKVAVPFRKVITLKNLALKSTSYRSLKNDWGSENYSPLVMLVKNDQIASSKTLEFVETIGLEKQKIMNIYGLSNTEYNRLAVLAFGTLGNESEFFGGIKYLAKESMPGLVTKAKQLKIAEKIVKREVVEDQATYFSQMELLLQPGRAMPEKIVNYAQVFITANLTAKDIGDALTTGEWETEVNSRGPTQIKEVPADILKAYSKEEIKPSTLKKPRHAAIATMGFLANSLHQMRRHVRNHQIHFISEENIYDYLPYIYFGRVNVIFKNEATPSQNNYISKLRENIQWLELFEKVTP